MGDRAADWDSKRCEVLGNVEDMSDEEVKMHDVLSGVSCMRSNCTEARNVGLSPLKAVAFDVRFSLSTDGDTFNEVQESCDYFTDAVCTRPV